MSSLHFKYCIWGSAGDTCYSTINSLQLNLTAFARKLSLLGRCSCNQKQNSKHPAKLACLSCVSIYHQSSRSVFGDFNRTNSSETSDFRTLRHPSHLCLCALKLHPKHNELAFRNHIRTWLFLFAFKSRVKEDELSCLIAVLVPWAFLMWV